MKETTKNSGALQGLKGKQVSVTLIALICTTVLVWGWERTPIAAIFPVEDRGPVRRFVRPADKQDNRDDTLFSGPTSMAMPSVEKSPSILAENLHPQSAAELPVQKLPAVSAEELPVQKSPAVSAEELPVQKSPAVSAEELPVQKLPAVSAEEVPVQKLPDVAAEKLPANSVEESLEEETQFTSENLPSTEKKGCNYTEGKWVYDASRPLYSGTGCKRWLSEMWACRMMQRTDFSYEKFRWQPDNCEMPEFEGQQILKRMQNKTLAFIGDSLGRQQFQSMMCLMTGGIDRPDVEDVGKKYGLVRARGAIRPDGWAYRFPETNTTVLYYWSASLCAIEPLNWTDTSTDFAMHLDRPAGFLRDNLYRFDIVILNTGHHWNRGKLNANRWRMHVNGKPNNDRNLRDIRSAQNFTVHSVVKWLDKQLGNYPHLRAFMRTISPRHFFNGDWDTGGRCDNTTPLSGIKTLLQKPAHDPVVESAVRGTQVELLDITGVSQLRDEAHISKYTLRAKNGSQDCLHWCLPGVPDTWNELLFAQLLFPQQRN